MVGCTGRAQGEEVLGGDPCGPATGGREPLDHGLLLDPGVEESEHVGDQGIQLHRGKPSGGEGDDDGGSAAEEGGAVSHRSG